MAIISVVVDWWGPFKGIDEVANNAPRWDKGVKALYMVLGRNNVCNYVGRTENDVRERLRGHLRVDRHDSLYVGKISSPGKPGPQSGGPADLDIAERTLIFVLQPHYNVQHKRYPPTDCGVVFSRLFDPKDHETPVFPTGKFPILAAYDPSFDETLLLKGKRLTRKRARVW